MALYHFHVDQISRSAGKAVVASAAYRAGEKLHDDYYGETFDYTHKGGVIVTKIMAPDYMPEPFYDRATLWNAVEAVEKHPKAQLAYSFDIALMNELSREDNWEMAIKYISDNFVSRGMICDVAFHEPEKDGISNPHIHVLCPIRPMNEDGTWGAKQRREYLVDADGNPLLDGKGRPLFNAVWTTDWGRPETLEEWRENWAKLVNDTFREKSIDAAVDHRSYKKQGLDIVPQIHEGPHVREMEKKGIRTAKGELNRFIRNMNMGIKALKNKLNNIIEAIAEISKEMSAMSMEPKEVSLLECLTKYFDERNAVAERFDYGSQKAKCTNLKKESRVLVVLRENHITTVDELREYAGQKQAELSDIAKSGNAKKNRVKEIKHILQYHAWYKEGKAIQEQVDRQHFKKRKAAMQAQKQEVLHKYYIAKRILTENNLLGKVDPVALKKEMQALETEANREYNRYKELSKDAKVLWDIVSYSQKMLSDRRTLRREERCL